MARPQDYNAPGVIDIGNKWFDCLDGKSPEATAAWNALNKRGYTPKKDDKAKPHSVDHHAEGKTLFKTLVDSGLARDGAKPSRATSTSDENAEKKALQGWVRPLHGEVGAIQRKTDDPALRTLPALGNLATQAGLQAAVGEMLALLGNAQALTALLPYNITADEATTGNVLLKAWRKSRSVTLVSRGGEQGKTTVNISVRGGFVTWLSVWWKIAKVRLKDQPQVLTALGVEIKSLRRGKPTVAAKASAPDPASTEPGVAAKAGAQDPASAEPSDG